MFEMYVISLFLKLKANFNDYVFKWDYDFEIFTIIMSLISGQHDGFRKC